MKLNRYFLPAACVLIILNTKVYSQENTSVTVKFGGYVNWTGFYDSRQTVSLREGYFLLYPAIYSYDKNGSDVNLKSGFNFLSIQTRLNAKIDGPEAFGAKASAFIEGEFFGTSDSDVNGFRLRHAFISLKWQNTLLTIGQGWHPMFITEAFPQVLSFNTGSPFQPFSRNPQIKLTQSLGGFNFSAAVYSQRDFTSNGPAGGSSSYLRNSGIPAMDFGFQAKFGNFLFGGNVDYKILTPQLKTSQNVATDETIGSYAGMAYAKISGGDFTFTAEGVYGQNLTDILMLGGYAVASSDFVSGKETYTNINAYSAWADVSYGKDFQIGCFAGYTQNLGSDDPITGKIYSRGENIDNIFRVSPRMHWTSGKVKLGLELEYTKAAYGAADNFGKVHSITEVANTRILLSTYYLF